MEQLFLLKRDNARKFTEDIEVGMVGINVPIPVPTSSFFGGWKRSF